MSTGISQLTVLFCPWVILGLGGGNTGEGGGRWSEIYPLPTEAGSVREEWGSL